MDADLHGLKIFRAGTLGRRGENIIYHESRQGQGTRIPGGQGSAKKYFFTTEDIRRRQGYGGQASGTEAISLGDRMAVSYSLTKGKKHLCRFSKRASAMVPNDSFRVC